MNNETLGATALQIPEERKPQVVSGRVKGGLVPRNMDELQRLAKLMSASGLMPKDMKAPESIAVAVMYGMEIGLSPMAAVQNIAVINGRPSLWGDALLALVEGSGLLENYSEEPVKDAKGDIIGFTSTAKRKGRDSEVSNTFTVEDAKKARLWAKAGPWTEYPTRMLKMRARSFTLRDGFPDVLKGVCSREEVMDITQPEVIEGAKVDRLNEKFRPALAPPPSEPEPASALPLSAEGEKREEGAEEVRLNFLPGEGDGQA